MEQNLADAVPKAAIISAAVEIEHFLSVIQSARHECPRLFVAFDSIITNLESGLEQFKCDLEKLLPEPAGSVSISPTSQFIKVILIQINQSSPRSEPNVLFSGPQ